MYQGNDPASQSERNLALWQADKMLGSMLSYQPANWLEANTAMLSSRLSWPRLLWTSSQRYPRFSPNAWSHVEARTKESMLTLISIAMIVSQASRGKRCLHSFEGWPPDAVRLKCILLARISINRLLPVRDPCRCGVFWLAP
ncbi:MAG: hypothetical protein R3E42_07940 [Burkholderiaceae bacterium]